MNDRDSFLLQARSNGPDGFDHAVLIRFPNKMDLMVEIGSRILEGTTQIKSGEVYKPLHPDPKNLSHQEEIREEK